MTAPLPATPTAPPPVTTPGQNGGGGGFPAPAYPARVYQRALGLTRRAVLLRLAAVPAEQTLVGGQKAKAWPLAALPEALRLALNSAADRQHFPDPAALLAHCAALATPPPPPCPVQTEGARLHADLFAAFEAHLPDRARLSGPDLEWAWSQICRHTLAGLAVAANAGQRADFKRSLAAQLLRELPALVRQRARQPLAALRRDLDRKLAAFRKAGREGLRDGRLLRSGNHQPGLCGNCATKLSALDMKLNRREREAWRIMKTKGLLCPACDAQNSFDVRKNKSYMPPRIARQITPLVEAALPWVKSAAAGRNAGPHIHRDWSDTAPGDFFVADDVTWNHEIFDTLPDGRYVIGRPECLYAADEFSGYPLDFILVFNAGTGPDGRPLKSAYNGRHVVQLRLNIHDLHGLPHVAWKHENGVWRSRLVRDSMHGEHWQDIVQAEDWLTDKLAARDTRYFIPRNPRAKTVEGDFRVLQERMRMERGFVGFNERAEKSDALKDFKRRVLAGKEDPRNEYLCLEQWRDRVSAILEDFMREPRDGRLDGRSPLQAWSEALQSRPLRKLADADRWMLSTHCRLETVKPHGIEFKIGRDSWGWADANLARYLGQQVWAFYHVDCPSLLTVANHKRTEFFSVAGNRLLANTASKHDLAAANRRIAGFNCSAPQKSDQWLSCERRPWV